MRSNRFSIFSIIVFGIIFITIILCISVKSYAIPAFARKYKTSCSTCHYAFPKLNAFGKAFFNNGYRYPAGTDPEMRKEEPVSLGSEGYKRVFPDAIWPSDMPGGFPASILVIGRTNVTPNIDPKLNFEFPHAFEFLYGATLGETFSVMGEVEIEEENELAYGFAVQYDLKPQFHVKVGNVDVMPVHEHNRLTASHHNYGNYRASSGSVSNRWRYRDDQTGIEFWGAAPGINKKGGITYHAGIVNGQGLYDLNKDKDFFGRFAYKIGGLSEIGGTEGMEEKTSGFWLDNSLTIGTFFYAGNSLLSKGTVDWGNKFSLYGVNGDLFWGNLNIISVYLKQNDKNPNGTNIEKDFKAFFTEADYVLYPWLIGLLRYEWDKVEGNDSKRSIIPGVAFMVRANVKITAELQHRLDDAGKNTDTYVFGLNLGF